MKDYAYDKQVFINATTGPADADKPIKTNASGVLDTSFIGYDAFQYIGPWTPTLSEEYPPSGVYEPGDFWNIEGVDDTTGYTFQTGLLAGQTARNGYLLIRGRDREWVMREDTGINPEMYYRIDGGTPLIADFQAGGYKLTHVAEGTDPTDAVTVSQIQSMDFDGTYLRVLGGNAMQAALDTGDNLIINVSDGIADTDAATWGQTKNYVDQLRADHDTELADRFTKGEHIVTSIGPVDAGKPIILDGTGKIDPSLVSASALYFVGGFTPTPSVEYPDTTTETPGAYWVVERVDVNLGYTFQSGDLQGLTAKNGSLMLWGTGGWTLLNDTINPDLYLRTDGSVAMSASLPMGGNRVVNMAEPVDDTDAVTFGLHKLKADQSDLDSHTGDTNNPHNTTAAQVGAPEGSWTWDGTTLAITIP
jgi:hypothetical protein